MLLDPFEEEFDQPRAFLQGSISFSSSQLSGKGRSLEWNRAEAYSLLRLCHKNCIHQSVQVRFFSWGVPVNLMMGLIVTFQVSEQEYFMTLGSEGFVERIEKVLARSLHKRRARRKRNALLSDKSDEK
jgi:hypothetical protein